MNKFVSSADLSAQMKAARELADRANKKNYNWDAVVEEFAIMADPKEVSDQLLAIYFEYTNLLSLDECANSITTDTNNQLYILRRLYQAIMRMENRGEGRLCISTRSDNEGK